MYFNNADWFLKFIFPSLVWRKESTEKVIYLTFDDGPIPDVTEFVLSELKKRSLKATFFCVGDNIRKHPEIATKILSEGHQIGNHTFNHLKGWHTADETYFNNIQKFESQLAELTGNKKKSKLFRPPHGLIKHSQIKVLNKEYSIIMWDVLTGDFNAKIRPEECLQKAIRYTRNGSIVVFHDSLKAEKNMSYALPKYLDHCLTVGYKFELL